MTHSLAGHEKTTFSLSRRKVLQGSCVLSLALLTVSCKTLEQIKAAGSQILVDVNKGVSSSRGQTRQQQLVQQTALQRIEKAGQLTSTYFGMPASNFDKAANLYKANFSAQLKSANSDLWALSKLYWAELKLDETEPKRSQDIIVIKAAVLDADSMASTDLRNKIGVMLANASITVALLTNDINMAKTAFNKGNQYVNEGLIQNKSMEALHKLELQTFFSLGACVANRQEDYLLAWNRIEQAQQQSSSALGKSSRVQSKTLSFTRDSLVQTLETQNAVVSVVVSPAEAYCLVSKYEKGKIEFYSEQLYTASGAIFDKHLMEWLLYGSSFREAFFRTGLSGWLGAYAAQDRRGDIHTINSVFYKKLIPIAQTQWSILFASVDKAIANSGVTAASNVTLIMPDDLMLLPVRIATNKDNKRQFLSSFNLTHIPSLSVTLNNRRAINNNANQISGLFNPTGDLTSSALEKQFSKFKVGVDKVVDIPKDLSAKQFIRLLRKQNSSVVFLSTHGQTIGRKDNGIRLGTNSLLTPNDIFSSKEKINADLVVLSACEVGTASRDLKPEPTNLASAFLKLGAKGVVSALWRVEENSTSLLMCKFLEQYIKENLHPSEALTIAQKWLRDSTADTFYGMLLDLLQTDGVNALAVQNVMASISEFDGNEKPYANPYYWGAFMYMGS